MLAAANVVEVKIITDTVTIALDQLSLREVAKVIFGDVTIAATKAATQSLPEETQKVIGNRPVYNLSVTGDGGAVISLNGGLVSLFIPYTLQAGETAEKIQAVHINEVGEIQWIIISGYDSITKILGFAVSHFSIYGVGYRAPHPV